MQELKTKKRYGRLQKAMGDHCLLAGSPLDAQDHYSTGSSRGGGGMQRAGHMSSAARTPVPSPTSARSILLLPQCLLQPWTWGAPRKSRYLSI